MVNACRPEARDVPSIGGRLAWPDVSRRNVGQPFMLSQKFLTDLKKLLLSGLLSSASDSNSRSNSFCRDVRLTGVSTASSMNMSPVAPPRSDLMPLPRSRIWRPDWLPPGIFTRLRPPSIVGTSMSPPRAAAVIDTGTLQCSSAPSRSNISCGSTSMKIYRSPGGPPRIPASPSPDRRMRVPVSTPAGMLTDSAFSFSSRPDPPQTRQGFLTIWPTPPQVGQVRSTVKKPCCARTFPMPEQVGQVCGSAPPSAPEPLQASHWTAVG